MNKEEKNILKIIFAYEYYKNNITERYMRNLSENVVLDNDCLDIENLELIYVIPFKKYNQLKNENARLKDKIDKAIEYINDNLIISSILDGKKYYTINDYSFDYKELLDILKEVE